ncbi:response regulator [Thalassoglobus neptunius]|uniref:response regulator n=1 Tax=Thalassoglobus neptunius TaxID=1938619 RepID=UPI0011B724B4|nr:response regulator [Thalassoglobus neptunius]
MSSLVVTSDQQPYVTRLVEITFRQSGCEVVICSNGRSTWETIQQVTPSLLVLNTDLGEMSGLDLCRMIRSHQDLRTVPIILLSDRGLHAPSEEVLSELGVSQVLTKPFNPAELRTFGLSEIMRYHKSRSSSHLRHFNN